MWLFVVQLEIVNAKRGCCSHHGGVAYCASNGRYVCNDNSYSPTCTCTPSYIYGCTDASAKNYNSSANKNDGSCIYYVYGCTNPDSVNYNPLAEKDDGSCATKIYGCTDINAYNYNPNANTDDGSCKEKVYGCTDVNAYNYNPRANTDDGSCQEKVYGCIDVEAMNYSENANTDDGTCKYEIQDNKVTSEEKINNGSDTNESVAGFFTLAGMGTVIYLIAKGHKKK